MTQASPTSPGEMPEKEDECQASEKTSMSSESEAEQVEAVQSAEESSPEPSSPEREPSPEKVSPEKEPSSEKEASVEEFSPERESQSKNVKSRGGRKRFGSPNRAGNTSRSRSIQRKAYPTKRHLTHCWYGRDCARADCWFLHPDGRKCDERPATRNGQPCRFRARRSAASDPPRRRRHTRRRHRQRSQISQRYKSPVTSKRRRSPSRSASTKPMRQPRWERKEQKEQKEPSEKESKQNHKVCKDGSTVKNDVKKEVKKDHLKKMTFRDFMMHHCEDGASPEDAILAYKAYGQELAKKELEILKPTGLFFDLYHPMAQLRLYDWQRQMAQMRARVFVEDLKADKYKGLCLRARRPVGIPGASASPTCPVAGHLQAPEFAFDANVGTLMISGLPVAVSTWDVVEALQDLPGFVTAAWTAASSDKELSRTFYASFSSTRTAKISVLDPFSSSELSALVLPPEMSMPERLQKDVIRKMDALLGISDDIAMALLGHVTETEIEMKLDIQILYLRRVHHFCFYAGRWCKDEWSLRDSCGAAALRETPTESAKIEGSLWTVGHEKRIKDFLELSEKELALTRPTVLHHQEPKVLERFNVVANEKILTVNDQKFQCQICSKFFKSQEYILKHIYRTHPKILDDVRQEQHQEMACHAFLGDSDRPSAEAFS